jgi:hypothetical protein
MTVLPQPGDARGDGTPTAAPPGRATAAGTPNQGCGIGPPATASTDGGAVREQAVTGSAPNGRTASSRPARVNPCGAAPWDVPVTTGTRWRRGWEPQPGPRHRLDPCQLTEGKVT